LGDACAYNRPPSGWMSTATVTMPHAGANVRDGDFLVPEEECACPWVFSPQHETGRNAIIRGESWTAPPLGPAQRIPIPPQTLARGKARANTERSLNFLACSVKTAAKTAGTRIWPLNSHCNAENLKMTYVTMAGTEPSRDREGSVLPRTHHGFLTGAARNRCFHTRSKPSVTAA